MDYEKPVRIAYTTVVMTRKHADTGDLFRVFVPALGRHLGPWVDTRELAWQNAWEQPRTRKLYQLAMANRNIRER